MEESKPKHIPPVPASHIVESYLPRVNGLSPQTIRTLSEHARATFQDAMLRRAPRVKPASDAEKALLKSTWDCATELLAAGWKNPEIPEPLVDNTLHIFGGPDITVNAPNGEAAEIYVECAFRAYEVSASPHMLYPLDDIELSAFQRANIRFGIAEAIFYRIRPMPHSKNVPYVAKISPDAHSVETMSGGCLNALHAILHAAVSIPGRREP